MYGNSNELQTTSVVPQINIEGNSPEDEGDADYTEGNIDNIGNSKQGNTNNDKGNGPGNTNNDKGNGPGNTYNNEDSPSENNEEYGNTRNMDYDEISIENGST